MHITFLTLVSKLIHLHFSFNVFKFLIWLLLLQAEICQLYPAKIETYLQQVFGTTVFFFASHQQYVAHYTLANLRKGTFLYKFNCSVGVV